MAPVAPAVPEVINEQQQVSNTLNRNINLNLIWIVGFGLDQFVEQMPTAAEAIGCRFFGCRQLRQPDFLGLDVGLRNAWLHLCMDDRQLGIEHAGDHGDSFEKSSDHSSLVLFPRQ